MGIFLLVIGTILGCIAVLAVLATLNNALALADSLLLAVVSAVMIGCGAIVDQLSSLRRSIDAANKPKPGI